MIQKTNIFTPDTHTYVRVGSRSKKLVFKKILRTYLMDDVILRPQ